jgi:hypothetical protein
VVEESNGSFVWGFGREGKHCLLLRGKQSQSTLIQPLLKVIDCVAAGRRKARTHHMGSPIRPFSAPITHSTTSRDIHRNLPTTTPRSRRRPSPRGRLEAKVRYREWRSGTYGACLSSGEVGFAACAAVSVWVSPRLR